MHGHIVKFVVLFVVLIALLPLTVAFAAGESSIVPIDGVANTCTVTGGFNFPVHYVYTGTGSDTFLMTAPGHGQLNTNFTQEPTIGYPVGTGNNTYGTGSLNYSLPPHTAITLSITTFSGDNYTGSSTTASLTYDCTTGARQVTSVPTMTEWGMIIFALLAGLSSVYYLRRQKRANS